jgi:hypothetical protein
MQVVYNIVLEKPINNRVNMIKAFLNHEQPFQCIVDNDENLKMYSLIDNNVFKKEDDDNYDITKYIKFPLVEADDVEIAKITFKPINSITAVEINISSDNLEGAIFLGDKNCHQDFYLTFENCKFSKKDNKICLSEGNLVKCESIINAKERANRALTNKTQKITNKLFSKIFADDNQSQEQKRQFLLNNYF